MFLDELKGRPLLNGGDLDELGDAVAHVLLRQRLEEVEVEDDSGVGVEGADAVLVLSGQVAAHLDKDQTKLPDKQIWIGVHMATMLLGS